MQYNIWFISTIIFLLIGCTEQTDSEISRKNLIQTLDAFYTAIEEGNSAKRFTLFADSALMLGDNGRITYVTDEVKEQMIGWDQDYVFRLKDVQHEKIDIEGNTAYTVNKYYYTWHTKGDTATWHKTKNVHIWKLNNAGDWRLHVDIWNRNW